MKKITYIVSIFSIILVILVYGCTPNEFVKHKEQIRQDPSFCKSYSGEEKDWCYAFAAEILADPEPCSNIVSNTIIKECFEEVAPEINDPQKCEKLPTTDEKNSCNTNVARVRKDVSYCDKIHGENYYCFSVVAVATLNESLCEDSTCIATIAASKNKPDLCKEIPDRTLRNELIDPRQSALTRCLLINAEYNNNSEICKSFTNQDDANLCFRSVALKTKDITLCKYLDVSECSIENGEKICQDDGAFLSRTDEFKILNCYSLIAANDPNQCDKVADDSMKLRNACYYQISRYNKDPTLCKHIIIPNMDDVTCENYLSTTGLVATSSRRT